MNAKLMYEVGLPRKWWARHWRWFIWKVTGKWWWGALRFAAERT